MANKAPTNETYPEFQSKQRTTPEMACAQTSLLNPPWRKTYLAESSAITAMETNTTNHCQRVISNMETEALVLHGKAYFEIGPWFALEHETESVHVLQSASSPVVDP